MEHLWIWESAAAALFQAVRYAALKELNKHLSTLVATYVRVLFSLPIVGAYLSLVLLATGAALPSVNARFLVCSALTATGQFLGSAMMIRVFQIGNFAVGTMLAKSDVILTALIGTALFSEAISQLGWIAILITVIGVLIVSAGRMPAGAWRQGHVGLTGILLGPATRLGLAIGFVNAIAYLLLREAMLALEPGTAPVVRAAYAGFAMTGFSVLLLGGWLLVTQPRELIKIRHHQPVGWLLGALSAAGTIMWVLATIGSNASYVAAVSQVQIVFSLLISRYWFKEAIRPVELFGIAIILVGVLMFKLV